MICFFKGSKDQVFGNGAIGNQTDIYAQFMQNSKSLILNGGGTFNGDPSALLKIDSTSRGFLPSRMSTTQKLNIANPTEGLVVYDNTLHKICVFTGVAWETIASS